jgi:NitT/TauT family transport system substrate-binding protein
MKPTQSRSLFFILFILLSLFVSACGTSATEEPSPVEVAPTEGDEAPSRSELTKVKVVTLPFITFAPYYLALDEGYFAEQGLDVELVNMAVQEEILPALSSGQVDVSSGLLSAGMLNAIARGANVRITADKGFVDPEGCINYAIIGRKDLVESGALDEVEDLQGKTINVVPSTWLEYYLARVLATAGLTLQDINITNLSAQAQPEAFAQSQIDVALNSEPWVTRLADSGHIPVLDLPQAILPESQSAVHLFGPNLLGENREAGERFTLAYLKGIEAYSQGKTERNLEIIAKYTQLEPELLEKMCWPAIRTDGRANTDSILDFQQWAKDAGYIDTLLTVDQFYDGSFVEKASEDSQY